MKFKVYEDSKNYTGTVVSLKTVQPLQGLDRLVGTTIFGNLCIIPKEYQIGDLFIYFPAESKLSQEYISKNNMYREPVLNVDPSEKGYFEENGRVKAIKFKGNKCTGLLMPLATLSLLGINVTNINEGDEFNEINGKEICRKYVIYKRESNSTGTKAVKVLDSLIDSRLFPEHMDTDHLLKYIQNIRLTDKISISIKLHGTSGRVAYTKVKRKLTWKDKIAKYFGVKVVEEEYGYVVGSRRVVKSIDFSDLPNKNHFYEEDLWTKVSKVYFEGRLNKGEMVYFEVIGVDFTGAEIQKGYSYKFAAPTVFVYRISNINDQGIEIDLTADQLTERCNELGVYQVPVITGTQSYVSYLESYGLNTDEKIEAHFKSYLDIPSTFDHTVIEEGICIRVERYPRPKIYKLKSPLFLIHESNMADKEVVDVESNS